MRTIQHTLSPAIWAVILSTCSGTPGRADTCRVPPVAGTNPTLATIRPWFEAASRNMLGSLGPALPPQISAGLTVPADGVPFYIPTALFKAIGWLESYDFTTTKLGWSQFVNGLTYMNTSGDCGTGLMQITTGMDLNKPSELSTWTDSEAQQIAADSAFNIGAGAKVIGGIGGKWAQAPDIGANDPRIYEHWYFAIWGYNAFSPVNNPLNPIYKKRPFPAFTFNNSAAMPYQEKIFSLVRAPNMAKVPKGLWDAVPVDDTLYTMVSDGSLGTPLPADWPGAVHTDPDEAAVIQSVVIEQGGVAAKGQYILSGSLTFTATFRIRNTSAKALVINRLTLGGRLNGACPNNACPDFSYVDNLKLDPDHEYTYTGTATLSQIGVYDFFPAYLRDDGTWNTSLANPYKGITSKAKILLVCGPAMTTLVAHAAQAATAAANGCPVGGAVSVSAVKDNNPYSGSLSCTITTPGGSQQAVSVVPATLNNEVAGAYMLSCIAPPGTSISGISPSPTQTLVDGGTVSWSVNLVTTATLGVINLVVSGYSGTLSCALNGGNVMAPSTVNNEPAGTYTLECTPPSGYTIGSILPSASQALAGGGTITFTVALVSAAVSLSLTPISTSSILQVGSVGGLVQISATYANVPSNSTIVLNILGLPANVTATSPSQAVGGSGTVTLSSNFTVGSNAPIGTYQLTASVSVAGITQTVGATLQVTPAPPPPLTVFCSITNPMILGTGGTISASASGGYPPYSYTINSANLGSASTLVAMPQALGTYTATVSVSDSHGQQASSACSAQVNAPQPSLSSLVPDRTPVAGQPFNLTVNGSGFVAGMQGYVCGSTADSSCFPVQTNFFTIDLVKTQAVFPSVQWNAHGTVFVKVVNPGNLASNFLSLVIN